MKNFRTYQLAKHFRVEVLRMNLKGNMKDQADRASLSIILNLAEGSAKTGAKDRRRFFLMAMGSLRECQALIEITNHTELTKLVDQLGGSINKLCKNPGPGFV